MTSLGLDAIAERADRATKGPWHAEYFGDNGYPQRVCNDAAFTIADTHWGGGGLAPDAEFIAHAREDVPALLAEVQRLTAAYAELGRNLADARLALARVTGQRDDALKTIRALVGHPEPTQPETFEEAAAHILGETDEDQAAEPSGTEAGNA